MSVWTYCVRAPADGRSQTGALAHVCVRVGVLVGVSTCAHAYVHVCMCTCL